jgi:hypothetical protein
VTFLTAYIAEIVDGLQNWHEDNWDTWRYGLMTEGERSAGTWRDEVEAAVGLVEPHLAEWGWLYSILADDESRSTLVKVLAFHALGHRRIRFPLSTPSYWRAIQDMEKLCVPGDSIDTDVCTIDRINLAIGDTPLSLYTTPQSAVAEFVLQQYCCKIAGGEIGAQAGDTVIDGGACWGDSTLMLALRSERVIAVESDPANMIILRKNMALNPTLAGRISIDERALWSETGVSLARAGIGPGAGVGTGTGGPPSVAIDDLGLDQLSFLKLDIEGTEVQTLLGAEQSLRKWKPRLAIAAYHHLSDLVSLPVYLSGFGYKFYLRHFSVHAEETVLFAA